MLHICNPDYREFINHIFVRNARNAATDFCILEIQTDISDVGILTDGIIQKAKPLSEGERKIKMKNYLTLKNLLSNIQFKFDSWVCLTEFGYMIYADIKEILRRNKIEDIEIKIDICYRETLFESLEVARGRDIRDLLKSNTGNAFAEKFNGKLNNMWRHFDVAIKSQKNAYLLNKLITDKTVREYYEDNETLIEAYDAYVDVKKLISNKPYC